MNQPAAAAHLATASDAPSWVKHPKLTAWVAEIAKAPQMEKRKKEYRNTRGSYEGNSGAAQPQISQSGNILLVCAPLHQPRRRSRTIEPYLAGEASAPQSRFFAGRRRRLPPTFSPTASRYRPTGW